MTSHTSFLKSGHLPTLIAALLYFDISFMVWVLLGPLAPFLREEFGLTATQQGLIVAVPLLGGSFFRPLLGLCGDRLGGRRAGLLGMTLTLIPLFIGWKGVNSPGDLYVIGLLLGIAGAAGGLGGFFLPSMLGATRDAVGSYGPGLMLLAVAFFGGAVALLHLGSLWTTRWQAPAVQRSGIFSSRDRVRGWLGAPTA